MEESKKRRGCENRKALKNREDQEKMEALDDNVPIYQQRRWKRCEMRR